jgi:hypothetical protein
LFSQKNVLRARSETFQPEKFSFFHPAKMGHSAQREILKLDKQTPITLILFVGHAAKTLKNRTKKEANNNSILFAFNTPESIHFW